MHRCVRFSLLCTAFIPLFLSPGNVAAEVDESLRVRGWEELVFDRKQANRFTANDDGEIIVESRGSVSVIKKDLSVDISNQPTLRWRWRVLDAAPATDLATKGSDDRSIAVYVAFPFIAEEATAFERIKQGIIAAATGEDVPGRVLTYVWGGDRDRGTVIESPYLKSAGMMKVLRPSDTPLDRWYAEHIDIAEDYRQSFGRPAPNPLYIAISADTDDTRSSAHAAVMDLEFSRKTSPLEK